MIEPLSAILEGASLFGLFRLIGAMSTTEIVFVFLCSKPIFILFAFLAGWRGYLDEDGSRKIES